MAITNTIRLATNIPVIAEIKYVDFYPSKPNPKDPTKLMSEQWGLKGTFWVQDGSDSGPIEGRVYLDVYQMASSPVQLQLAVPKGERDGVPQYSWVFPGKIQIVKREDGRKKFITISRVGEAAALQPALGTGVTPTAATVQVTSPVTKASTAWTGETRLTPATYEWDALEARLLRSKQIACRIWGADYDPRALVAFTATAFIAADRHNLPVEPATVYVGAQQTLDPVGHATDVQVTELRYMLNSGVFTTAERQEWLAKIYGATQASMAQDVERLKKIITTRTAAPAGAGPGHPNSFANMPAALQNDSAGEDPLPF